MKPLVQFSHSGNMGDMFYAIPLMQELCEQLKSNAWLHLQTNVRLHKFSNHPNGVFGFTKNNVEFFLPLLNKIQFIEKITYDDNIPKHDGVCINLSDFRNIGLNVFGGNIEQWYYNLIRLHCSQDFSKQRIFVEQDTRFREKVIIVNSLRFNNATLDFSVIQNHKDDFVFIGLEEEYKRFCNVAFKVEFYQIKDALEFARIVAGSRGIISNQTGLFAIAEMLKVPRVLMTDEFNCFSDGKLVGGSVNVHPCGGWFEVAQTTAKLKCSVDCLLER